MARIMLIGGDRDRTSGIRSILRQDGHNVSMLREVRGWRGREEKLQPELVIAAVDSTESVLSDRGRAVRGFPAPLLFAQHGADFFRDIQLDERLVDRIASPFMSEEFLGKVDALVRVRRVVMRDPTLDTTADEDGAKGLRSLGGGLAALLGTRVPRHQKPLSAYLEVAARVAEWTEKRDAFLPGHAERVTSYCAMIAEALTLDDQETSALLRAAMLHDIGKVSFSMKMLRQKEPLEESQMRLIRTHPKKGAALVKALDRQDEEVADAILYHHERPDGSGYYGLDGQSIPLSARILAVAEVYDAMTSSKLRPTLSTEEALASLQSTRGQDLDADCVDALVDKLKPPPGSIPFNYQG
jgi:HD-GYP domain-containing protein (c-di-GMP phosphodiesterase class II)